MQVSLYDQNGKKLTKKVTVQDEVFASDVNAALLAQYVYVYHSNQRQSNAHTKDRSEVRGGGRKPWKQKGTGRARAGSSRSPIWRGGGVTFGPTNQANYKRSISKKMRVRAFRSAFSSLQSDGKLFVVDKLQLDAKKPLTQQVAKLQAAFDLGKVMIVTRSVNPELVKACSNLQKVMVKPVNEISVYDLLNQAVILEEESLEYVHGKWGVKD